MRQIEMAELMIASNNFTGSYAKCLVVATPQDQLTQGKAVADGYGLSSEDVSRIEREMGKLGREFKLIEESYGRDVLALVVYVAYVKKLLRNGIVTRYLSRRYPEILTEFELLIEAADPTPEV
jgi:RepB plasmid partitioning protein